MRQSIFLVLAGAAGMTGCQPGRPGNYLSSYELPYTVEGVFASTDAPLGFTAADVIARLSVPVDTMAEVKKTGDWVPVALDVVYTQKPGDVEVRRYTEGWPFEGDVLAFQADLVVDGTFDGWDVLGEAQVTILAQAVDAVATAHDERTVTVDPGMKAWLGRIDYSYGPVDLDWVGPKSYGSGLEGGIATVYDPRGLLTYPAVWNEGL